MFKRSYTMSLDRVHDTLRVREGSDSIVLYVNQDPRRLVAGLNGAQARLKSIDENTTEEEKLKIAKMFSSVLFGDEQTEKLSEFYHNDPGCIISVCGKYFSDRLAKLITKAQKKLK